MPTAQLQPYKSRVPQILRMIQNAKEAKDLNEYRQQQLLFQRQKEAATQARHEEDVGLREREVRLKRKKQTLDWNKLAQERDIARANYIKNALDRGNDEDINRALSLMPQGLKYSEDETLSVSTSGEEVTIKTKDGKITGRAKDVSEMMGEIGSGKKIDNQMLQKYAEKGVSFEEKEKDTPKTLMSAYLMGDITREQWLKDEKDLAESRDTGETPEQRDQRQRNMTLFKEEVEKRIIDYRQKYKLDPAMELAFRAFTGSMVGQLKMAQMKPEELTEAISKMAKVFEGLAKLDKPATEYKTDKDVIKDYSEGKLKLEESIKILKEQFGYAD